MVAEAFEAFNGVSRESFVVGRSRLFYAVDATGAGLWPAVDVFLVGIFRNSGLVSH